MTLTVSYDQMTAVTDSGIRLKAVPLAMLPSGETDWTAPPITAGQTCLGCPLSRDGSVCEGYALMHTVCGKHQRKDNRAIVWRKA